MLRHAPESPEARAAWSRHWINVGFTALEDLLSRTAGEACVGDTITMADCCLVPQVGTLSKLFMTEVEQVGFTPLNQLNSQCIRRIFSY